MAKGGLAGLDTTFNYAWALVRSQYKQDRQKGISLLLELLKTCPERRRECLYSLAVGYYRQDDLLSARKYNEELLALEPNNQQAQAMSRVVKKKMTQDGLIGMAVFGGAAALVAGLAYAFRKK